MADHTLFFATDIHGSERCFRKFLNAGPFYGADVLLMGGDMTGKMVMPVVRRAGGTFATHVAGRERIVDADGLPALKASMADAGLYPHECDPDELAALEGDPEAVDRLFLRLMEDKLERWLALAAERLDGRCLCLMAPGNDDPAFVDAVLDAADAVGSSSCPAASSCCRSARRIRRPGTRRASSPRTTSPRSSRRRRPA